MATKKAISFKSGGETYKLAYTINAQVKFEELAGVDFSKVFEVFEAAEQGQIAVKRIRQIFWVGLMDAQDQITERQAGEIMDDLGLVETMTKIGEAIQKAYPQASAAADGEAGNAQAAAAEA